MTKIRKQKRKKKFRANVNRKRLRNKLQKLPTIECKEIEDSWESKRSIKTNFRDMGLAYEPNEVFKIPSTKRGLLDAVKRSKKLSKQGENSDNDDDDDDDYGTGKKRVNVAEKIHVANTLEAEAKAPRERLFRLPKNQVQFVTYLMEKYGDDYKAMARDRKNHYQLTWCQIRAKINKFKSIPEQYAEYLLKSGEIVLDDPTPLEETRKRIGEENAMKYSAPKVQKIAKKRKPSEWEVEDAFHVGEKNLTDDDDDDDGTNGAGVDATNDNGLKKLKLFSDDEDSDNDGEIKRNGTTKSVNINEKERGKNLDSNDQKNPLVVTRVAKKTKKSVSSIRKRDSSESESDSDDEEAALDGDGDDVDGFVNLSDVSEGEISEDDILDDGEFVTDSDDVDD